VRQVVLSFLETKVDDLMVKTLLVVGNKAKVESWRYITMHSVACKAQDLEREVSKV